MRVAVDIVVGGGASGWSVGVRDAGVAVATRAGDADSRVGVGVGAWVTDSGTGLVAMLLVAVAIGSVWSLLQAIKPMTMNAKDNVVRKFFS